VQHQGSYSLSLARHFGNIPLDNVKSRDNAVYFTLARSWIVVYSEQWTLPLTLLALILLLVTMWVGFRKRLLSRKGMISGFLVSLLMIVAAAAFGIAAQVLFTTIYFELDNVLSLSDLINLRRTLIFEGNKWIVISLILNVLILIGLQRLFRRKTTVSDLFFGSLLLWSILAVISAFYLPGVGYIFLWPLIIALAGSLIAFSIVSEIVPKYLILFVLCALPCILIYVPVGYMLFEALTMMEAAIPIAILSLPASLVIHATSFFFEPPVPHKVAYLKSFSLSVKAT